MVQHHQIKIDGATTDAGDEARVGWRASLLNGIT